MSFLGGEIVFLMERNRHQILNGALKRGIRQIGRIYGQTDMCSSEWGKIRMCPE